MIKITILGFAGRMGQAIAREVGDHPGCKLVGGVILQGTDAPRPDGVFVTSKTDEAIAIADVVIDFTLAKAVPGNAQLAAKHNKAYVCGVTGLGANALDAIKQAAEKIPVVQASNTSMSLAVMKQLTTLAAKLLAGLDYDIAIYDEHHRLKQDAPSGTAKTLGEAVARGNSGKKAPSYASIRAGAIVGEHEVAFVGQGEIIRLRHSVTDRRIFARGAVEAALWLHGKPAGLYGMDDVMGMGKN